MGLSLSLCNTYDANMFIDWIDTRTGILFVQWTSYDFLHRQYDTVLAAKANQRSTLFDRFAGIINLENSTVRAELRGRQIVLGRI